MEKLPDSFYVCILKIHSSALYSDILLPAYCFCFLLFGWKLLVDTNNSSVTVHGIFLQGGHTNWTVKTNYFQFACGNIL